MPIIQHPAAQEELAHLGETQDIIRAEQAIVEEEYEAASRELAVARQFDPDMVPLREMLFARATQMRRNLGLALLKPYFTRVDFQESGGEACVYYIGKYGVMRSNNLEIQVVDWRSPIANLYYSGQIGPMHYTAPDGAVHGELTLKRQLGIEDGQLLTIFDTDVVSQDTYLQSVLGAMSGDRLREIVTSIQAEQNFVIRYPLSQTLVVQGVAGSGKTTIALHRIAYLLYAFQDKLMPENMLILAPNPLFLSFIAGVLPDLGVERVRQTTFERFISDYLDEAMPPVVPAHTPEAVLNLPPDERDRVALIAGCKGSLEMGARLDIWLDEYEQRFVPRSDIAFGPVMLYSEEQLRRFLLVDERPFPLARRVAEFKKDLKRRTKEAEATVTQWLAAETDRRASAIRSSMPEGDAKRERLTKLYKSRDARIAEVKKRVRPFMGEVMARFPPLEIRDLYREFLNDLSHQDEGGPLAITADATLTHMEGGAVEPEDVALITLIAMRVMELPRLDIRHIVIDEAQDFSALECRLLGRISHSATMTIVGDLMQGVRAWRGLQDWRLLTDGVFGGKAVTHHLVTSYRNTVEIMNTALKVAARHPTPGQQAARPVLRHGEPPEFCAFQSPDQQAGHIAARIDAWRAQGLATIAVITRTADERAAIAARLPESLGARVLDVDQSAYQGGVLLAQAIDVKGFEFDGVIMADAGEDAFPDRALDARLLYVCLTRPLHRLFILYRGALSPVFGD